MTLGVGALIRGTPKQTCEYVITAITAIAFAFLARGKEQRFPSLEEGGAQLGESERAAPRKQTGEYVTVVPTDIAIAFMTARGKEKRLPSLEEGGAQLDESERAAPRPAAHHKTPSCQGTDGAGGNIHRRRKARRCTCLTTRLMQGMLTLAAAATAVGGSTWSSTQFVELSGSKRTSTLANALFLTSLSSTTAVQPSLIAASGK